jgi:hypothetical protein
MLRGRPVQELYERAGDGPCFDPTRLRGGAHNHDADGPRSDHDDGRRPWFGGGDNAQASLDLYQSGIYISNC